MSARLRTELPSSEQYNFLSEAEMKNLRLQTQIPSWRDLKVQEEYLPKLRIYSRFECRFPSQGSRGKMFVWFEGLECGRDY